MYTHTQRRSRYSRYITFDVTHKLTLAIHTYRRANEKKKPTYWKLSLFNLTQPWPLLLIYFFSLSHSPSFYAFLCYGIGKRTCINSNKHFCIWSYICALFMCILLLFCVYILAAYISYISYMYGQRSARVYACVCNASVRYRMVAHIAPNATACLTKCAHLKQQQQFRIYIYIA